MTISDIMGHTLCSRILFFGAAAFVCGDFITTLLALFYNRIWYGAVLARRVDPSFAPRAALFLPC